MGRETRLRAVLLGCAIAIWSCAMIWLAVTSGVQHDYVLYLQQWRLVLAGSDPWSTDNAYGPLHNLLAYLLPLGDLAPKLAIAGALLLANVFLVRALHRAGAGGWFAIYLLALPANCLIVSMGFAYGLNDALVAAFVIAAIVARQEENWVAAGVWLGLAVLLKLYPVILVPLFALDAGRVRWKLISAAAVVMLAGMGAAALVWGGAVARPFLFAVEREAKILSILSALSFHPELVGPRVVDALVRTNAILVAAVALLSVVIAWRSRTHWLEASVLGLLALLASYKVGHQQFYLPWLCLVAALPLAGTPSARRLALICMAFMVFLSFFQWGYAYPSDGYREIWGGVRRNVGFLAFALTIATFAAYAASARFRALKGQSAGLATATEKT